MSKWEVYLRKSDENISIVKFNNKREAEDEVKYRKDLCKNMNITSNPDYKVRRVR
jgi:hypothetical protein|tara:strand:- start:297 stop:461 length:165 start_codon:yes stop_codon:yes gene_type:complete